jgi:hypothetical protein
VPACSGCRRGARDNIVAALAHSHGRIYGRNGATELIGMKPTTLSARLKKLRLKSNYNETFAYDLFPTPVLFLSAGSLGRSGALSAKSLGFEVMLAQQAIERLTIEIGSLRSSGDVARVVIELVSQV